MPPKKVNVVTWLWIPDRDYHAQYTEIHVNKLYWMVKRHYPNLGKFICVTDCKSIVFDPDICIVPLWKELSDLKNPYGPGTPSCYRRLRAFAPDMRDILGERFVS